jgi:antitoxin (DNA-binding transcriptional repressor) of toxin-antitoxin stability system
MATTAKRDKKEQVARGEEVILMEQDREVARLIPPQPRDEVVGEYAGVPEFSANYR